MKSELKILVCGDRKWTDDILISEVLTLFSDMDIYVTVIDGGASGADTLGHLVAKKLGMGTLTYKAQWKNGLAAGPIRNKRMLDEGKPQLVFAFHRNIAKSKGTKDMVNRARRLGIPTCVFPQKKFA
jgi:hypothetical protein